MKFNEDILKEFNLDVKSVIEPVNVMKVKDLLHFLKTCAERIAQKSQLYEDTDDVEIELDCIDIVTAKINDFTQAFKDLIIFMRKEEQTHRNAASLRYAITSFDTFGFVQTETEKLFLRELLIRNEITHDYFNREIHEQKLIWLMKNCSTGAVDIYRDLNEYCTNNALLERYVDRNS